MTNELQSLQQAKNLLTNILNANDPIESMQARLALMDFVGTRNTENTVAFCMESWQAGLSLFRLMLKENRSTLDMWPENFRKLITGVASILVSEFKSHPHEASVMFSFFETKMWMPSRGNQAADAWFGFLITTLNRELGRDVHEIMRQNLK